MRRLQDFPQVEQLWSVSRSGSSRMSSLKEDGRTVVYKSADLRALFAWHKVMYDLEPDTVFHLGANPMVNGAPRNLVDVNIVGTHNILENCPERCRFVFASSATVYGNGNAFHSKETDRLKPNSVYGATKVACESLVSAYGRLGRIRPVSLRLVANVGAGATHGIVLDFIRKLQSDSKCLEVLGDHPGSTKPFCHVSDTVEAMILAAQDPRWMGEINVGLSNEINVEEIAQAVMEVVGIRKPIKWLGEGANWKGDNRVVRIDNWKARMLGWTPKYKYSRNAVVRGTLDLLEETKSTAAA